MIDLDWLKTVQFNTDSGRVTGLAGIGSQWIVFNCERDEEDPELGKEIVIKMPNTPRLGWHIREIPPDLESKPTYDASRVNRKLRAQVGNQLFDSMVEPYNDLYEYIIAALHKGGLQPIQSMIDDDDSKAFFLFLLKTPAIRRRLEDIAIVDTGGDSREVVMLNGIVYAIEETREAASAWARSMLVTLDGIPDLDGAAPEKLCENPVWIWGGAVLDGFFTSEEMIDSAAFIAQQFGNLDQRSDIHRLRFEMFAFLSLLSLVVERDKLQRLTKFCNLNGFSFTMPDPAPEKPHEPQDPKDKPLIGKMPTLSPPWVAPRFPEEGYVDPMAQDPELLTAAAATFREFTARMAAAAHAVGIAVMLPHPESESDHYWKPWRSVVPVTDSASPVFPDDDVASELCLIQRLLVSAQAILARRDGSAVPDGMEQLIEETGYVALGRSHDIRERPRLNATNSMGRIAAILHREGFIHGDLQPQNLTFKEDGEIQSMFDLSRTFNPGRALTALERASDLAVIKKHVSFLEWEAAKFGYRSEAPDADEVLAYFKQQ